MEDASGTSFTAFRASNKLSDFDPQLEEKKGYHSAGLLPAVSLLKMNGRSFLIRRWRVERVAGVLATHISCSGE